MNLLKILFFFSFFIFFSEASLAYGYYQYPQTSAQSPGQPCIPIEIAMAALNSKPQSDNKTSYSADKRKLDRSLERAVDKKDKTEDKIAEEIHVLKKSFKKDVFIDKNGKLETNKAVANSISEYMESKKDEWACENDSASLIFNYPDFFNFLKDSLLPQAEADSSSKKNDLTNSSAPYKGTLPSYESNYTKKECADAGRVWVNGKCEEKIISVPIKKADIKKTGSSGKKNDLTNSSAPYKGTLPSYESNYTKKECADAGRVWINGKCEEKIISVPIKKADIKKTGSSGKKNDLTNSSAPYKGTLPSYGAKHTKKECADAGRVWINGKCEEKIILVPVNVQKTIQLPVNVQKECIDAGRVWVNGKCVQKTIRPPVNVQKIVPLRNEVKTETSNSNNQTSCKKSNWKKQEYFKNDGEVKDKFCDEYASNKRECKKALRNMKKYHRDLKRDSDKIESYERKLSDLDPDDYEDDKEETEAGGPCIGCYKKLQALYSPTTSQTIGNLALLVGGAGLSYLGVREGRKAQNETNELRSWQGYEAENNLGYSLAGLSLGYPFIAQGAYGLTRPKPSVCNQTVNPYRSYGWQ